MKARRTIVLVAALASSVGTPAARADTYAPLAKPGPALTVAQAKLVASLACSAGIEHAATTPVLLVHGTGADVKDNWSWTYEPGLTKLGIPWCAVDMPDHANGDIQVNAEYVVYAMRTMFARAGRKIAVIGHSQGGMLPRWALRFWPDTRRKVTEVIAFAPTNHGTTVFDGDCSKPCSAATWQQAAGSHFIRALNSHTETFAHISYTNVFTHTDETVKPNLDSSGTSSLHRGHGAITNVATQDICPADPFEHLLIGTIDPVAYAIAVDALKHPGPANPSRVSHSVCLQLLQPGVNLVTFPVDAVSAALDAETYPSTAIPAEPPLRCYVTATCRRRPRRA